MIKVATFLNAGLNWPYPQAPLSFLMLQVQHRKAGNRSVFFYNSLCQDVTTVNMNSQWLIQA